jgi:hypothetical protein
MSGTVSIMQPYLFPYLGYFKLIAKSDKFVALDNVNYMKKGWINKNSFLKKGRQIKWTLPLIKVSQNKKINEIKIFEPTKNLEKLKKLIIDSYYVKGTDQKNELILIERIFSSDEHNLSKFILNTIEKIMEFFDLKTDYYSSSQIKSDSSHKGEDRIISICKNLNASTYLNLPGGKNLYSAANFNSNSIILKFLIDDQSMFEHQNFSIIHYIFKNTKKEIKNYLLS